MRKRRRRIRGLCTVYQIMQNYKEYIRYLENKKKGGGEMREHQLKTLPAYFEAISLRMKNFDVRTFDRNFQIGDIIIFNEYELSMKRYTGKKVKRTIIYMQTNPMFGLKKGWVILGLK